MCMEFLVRIKAKLSSFFNRIRGRSSTEEPGSSTPTPGSPQQGDHLQPDASQSQGKDDVDNSRNINDKTAKDGTAVQQHSTSNTSATNNNDTTIPQLDLATGNEPTEPVTEIPSRCGKVLVSFTYMPGANKLNMKVIRTIELPPARVVGAESVRIHMCILPNREQRCKTRTIVVLQSQAIFNQTFHFVHMTKDILETCAIRIRLYGTKRFGKHIIGEARIPLSKVDLTSPLADGDIWKVFNPKGAVAKLFGIDEEDEVDEIDDWVE